MAQSILYSEISCVCILVLLLLCIKIRKSMFLQAQRQQFLVVAVSNILLFVLDAVWIFIDNHVLGTTVRANWLLNGCYYILTGFLGLAWFNYSETVQESSLILEKRKKYLVWTPIVILVVMVLASAKTGWMFYIDDHNVYHRGPFYALQLLCSYGYVIFTALKAFYLSFRTDDYRRKQDMRTLSFFVVPTLISGAIQVWFPGYPILCVGNTLGILYVYLTLQEQLISMDALTKLNNRNQLYQYLSAKFAHPDDMENLYLLLMDIDYFKRINDQYGHVEGDHALKLVAKSLMKSCGRRRFFICRFGGDEFMVICELDESEPIESVCNGIHEELKKTGTPYDLSLSIGYARYTADIKNQQELIEKADEELYKVKKSRKAERIA